MVHIPVLKEEVIRYLAPRSNENFIDCTIGQAGHAFAILEQNAPAGKVLGIDWDPKIIKSLQFKVQGSELKERIILVCDNFANLKEIVRKQKFTNPAGILFDLGMSTWHLKEAGRGFSFQKDEPLDMRYSTERQELTAARIINSWPPQEIERILTEYGEEKFARKISQAIAQQRRQKSIQTTPELVEVIKKSVPSWYQRQRIHPATRTFQALRIRVNNELINLKRGLRAALEILAPQGRVVVISFHSLEDRIVKNFFQDHQDRLVILTKKPVRPSQKEIQNNPSSRSAKLRAAKRL